MRDSVFSADVEHDLAPSDGVVDLALAAIGRLVARDTVGDLLIKGTYLDRLVEAAISPDPKPIRMLLADMRRAGVLPDRIAEAYIPAGARKIGQGWDDDNLSFSAVTLGVYRLSAMLRQVGYSGIADDMGQRARSAMLVIVPLGEPHTLGAAVLASQLRRMGPSVSLQLSLSLSGLASVMDRHHFAGALISIGNVNQLEVCTMLVSTMRSLSTGNMPIVVGGAVLDLGREKVFCKQADLVTNDPEKALSFLGLTARGDEIGKSVEMTGGGLI